MPKEDRSLRKYMQKLYSLNLVKVTGRNSGRIHEIAHPAEVLDEEISNEILEKMPDWFRLLREAYK